MANNEPKRHPHADCPSPADCYEQGVADGRAQLAARVAELEAALVAAHATCSPHGQDVIDRTLLADTGDGNGE